jgi:hypothetical protein
VNAAEKSELEVLGLASKFNWVTSGRICAWSALSTIGAAFVGYFLRLDPLPATLLPGLLGYTLAIVLILHLSIGWMPRWRRYFRRIFLVLALPLPPLASFAFTDIHFWNLEDTRVHQYVSMVRTKLDYYQRIHGRYPSSLDELSNAPPKPRRLRYATSGNTYVFVFDGDLYSSSSGEGFDDN